MKNSLYLIATAVMACALQPATAQHTHGPGCHDHALLPGQQDEAHAPSQLKLSPSQQHNLGIKTANSQIKTISRSLQLPVRLIENPQARSLLASPLQAKVSAVHVNIGERVEAGKPLVQLQPLAIGAEPITLKAPSSGIIRSIETAAGQIVDPSQNLLSIVGEDHLLAAISLYADMDPELLKRGDKIRLNTARSGAAAMEAEILRQQETADASGNVVFLAKLTKAPASLRANMRARAELPLQQQQDAIVIPAAALLGKLGSYFVFVKLENGDYERREVQVGIKNVDEVEIIEGVLPEEAVVTQGNYQLQFISNQAAPAAAADEHAGHSH